MKIGLNDWYLKILIIMSTKSCEVGHERNQEIISFNERLLSRCFNLD